MAFSVEESCQSGDIFYGRRRVLCFVFCGIRLAFYLISNGSFMLPELLILCIVYGNGGNWRI